MDTYEVKVTATLSDTIEAFGNYANYEINNTVAEIEFMNNLRKELNKTDLKVEHVKFRDVKDRFEPFIIFKLPKNLELFFYKKMPFNANAITIQLKEMIESDENTYNPRWIYESNVECLYIDAWKHIKCRGFIAPVSLKYKHEVDVLIKAIENVINEHSVQRIEM